MHTPTRPRLIWARDAAPPRSVPVRVAVQPQAQVIDIRTGKPWRRPQTPPWLFLLDMAFVFLVVLLGTWLFSKMRGG